MLSKDRMINNTRQLELVDVNELIKEGRDLFDQWLPQRVNLKVNLTPDLPPISGNREQLRQIIMELLINAAIESMGVAGSAAGSAARSGEVSLATSYEVFTYRTNKGYFIGDSEPEPGAYICLSVNSAGVSLDSETIAFIADPVYWDVPAQKVERLEARYSLKMLPYLLPVIREHRGRMVIYSQPEVGTTFKVLLPVHETAVQVTPTGAQSNRVSAKSAKTAVLVIDDNSSMREAVTEILSLLPDVTIHTAANGQEGLQIFQQEQNITLVLLDMNMPVMNGPQTYERLQEIAPQVKVIVSTSTSQAEALLCFEGRKSPAFLQKPYNADTLLHVVERELATA